MGQADTKICPLTQEDAFSRLNENDVKRIGAAFRRSVGMGSLMPKATFIREVLGDSFPGQLAGDIYRAFGGGSKGISYKDLMAGLAFLTRGEQEEKVRFLFMLLSADGELVYREDVRRLILAVDGTKMPEVVVKRLFGRNDSITFPPFRSWTFQNYKTFSLAYWLFDCPNMQIIEEKETPPSYHKTIANVSGVSETEVEGIERRYISLKAPSKTGKLDWEVFSPALTTCVPEHLHKGLFAAIDSNGDGHIDLKEMCSAIALCCRKTVNDRLKFSFRVLDGDGNGRLSVKELTNMVEVCMRLRQPEWCQAAVDMDNEDGEESVEWKVEEAVKELLESSQSDKEEGLSLNAYLKWSETSWLIQALLDFLYQMCHLVFGLKPRKKEEYDIVKRWVQREKKQPRKSGDVVYLISTNWWKTWKSRVSPKIPSFQPPSSPSYSSTEMPVSTSQNGSVSNQEASSSKRDEMRINTEVSTSPAHRQKRRLPRFGLGPIDNSILCEADTRKFSVISLTNEGTALKKHTVLAEGSNFQLLPEPVWQSLVEWYGTRLALPRQVIVEEGRPIVELYPIPLKLYKHSTQPMKSASNWSGVGLGFLLGGGSSSSSVPSVPQPRRVLGYSASLSKKTSIRKLYEYILGRLKLRPDDLRLWDMQNESNAELWDEDDERTFEELKLEENHKVLVEIRSRDLSWPEELLFLTSKKGRKRANSMSGRAPVKGATGLSNLGNTCFMNSALQCMSHTKPLTDYFLNGYFLYDLNRDNPLGLQGRIARRYSDLVADLWKGDASSIAPLKIRWTIGKYAPRFNGFQQHDSQELLAFLLDGLHEDLNRVHERPYAELKDSDGRPDDIVAAEAWDNHLKRNRSVVVDLFQGQLRSEVVCKICGYESVRFDPFSFLSLPLPMENQMYTEVSVIQRNGEVPIRYGLRLSTTDKYGDLKAALCRLSGLKETSLFIVETLGGTIRGVPKDSQKLKMGANYLHAYELPAEDEEEEEEKSQPVDLKTEESVATSSVNEEDASSPEESVVKSHDESGMNGEVKPGENENVGISSSGENSPETRLCSCLTMDRKEVTDHPLSPTKLNQEVQPPQKESSVDGTESEETSSPKQVNGIGNFLVAINRRMIPMDSFFLPHQKSRPYPFGLPVIVKWIAGKTQQRELYEDVMRQVERFLSPKESQEREEDDEEDKPGFQYPFVLKSVTKEGMICSKCGWHRCCRGCTVDCNDAVYQPSNSFLAIDWNTVDYYLRYQFSQDRLLQDHSSIEQNRQQDIQPIDLDQCFEAFTKEEELGEEESWYCSKCKKHQIATKKMNIWKLPPVLVIHLKRFQIVNGRWVKSHKSVKFPVNNFDPSRYVYISRSDGASSSLDTGSSPPSQQSEQLRPQSVQDLDMRKEEEDRSGVSSSSEEKPDEDGFELLQEENVSSKSSVGVLPAVETRIGHRYNLYALCIHSGIMGGGHYVTFAKNDHVKKWYVFNDSSCKETEENRVESESPYLLFYEREGFQFRFDSEGREKANANGDDDDDYNSDYRRSCVIQ